MKQSKEEKLHPKILDVLKKVKLNYPLKVVDFTQNQ